MRGAIGVMLVAIAIASVVSGFQGDISTSLSAALSTRVKSAKYCSSSQEDIHEQVEDLIDDLSKKNRGKVTTSCTAASTESSVKYTTTTVTEWDQLCSFTETGDVTTASSRTNSQKTSSLGSSVDLVESDCVASESDVSRSIEEFDGSYSNTETQKTVANCTVTENQSGGYSTLKSCSDTTTYEDEAFGLSSMVSYSDETGCTVSQSDSDTVSVYSKKSAMCTVTQTETTSSGGDDLSVVTSVLKETCTTGDINVSDGVTDATSCTDVVTNTVTTTVSRVGATTGAEQAILSEDDEELPTVAATLHAEVLRQLAKETNNIRQKYDPRL